MTSTFSRHILHLQNLELTADSISNQLKEDIFSTLRRRGAVVGISGGIDSSVTLALTVRALGKEKVKGIIMPEKDSSPDSKELALLLAERYQVETIEEDITNALIGLGCYHRRDEAVKSVFPEYNPDDFKMKIGINPYAIHKKIPSVFSLTIIDKHGRATSRLLPPKEYLQIVAASNFKQRCRMSMLYYHAERMHFAVVGTPNKHETEQGFFVKYGDGAADLMPIGHLFKTQVYQLAEYLGIPKEIIERTPTSDTYSAEQTQEEFFFQIPFREMDLLWHAYENHYPIQEVASVMNKRVDEIEAIYSNFARKQKTTSYLRLSPIRHL